ncbi:hypothetical protein Droror1_Dr00025575 [Drosera rotundifolia]
MVPGLLGQDLVPGLLSSWPSLGLPLGPLWRFGSPAHGVPSLLGPQSSWAEWANAALSPASAALGRRRRNLTPSQFPIANSPSVTTVS